MPIAAKYPGEVTAKSTRTARGFCALVLVGEVGKATLY